MSASDEVERTAPVAAKEDPESLVLRAKPRPVVRFRRGLIIGTAGLVSAGLLAVAWFALEPPSFRRLAGQEHGEPRIRPAPEALANAPASYGDVPRLGPPLPGDLGRPILEHQRSLEAAGEPAGPDPSLLEAERARAAAEAERQRKAAARDAARASGLLVQLGGGGGSAEGAGNVDAPPAPANDASADLHKPAGGTEGRGGGIARSVAGSDAGAPTAEASALRLSAGTVISASLITGLNSDVPGMVLAQVTADARDSATGRTVLIPQGSRLIGSYDSQVAYGQRRARVVWQRLVFPDGASLPLDNVPATDSSGYSGVEGRVDNHGWRLLKGVLVSTLLGVGTELSLGGGEGELVRAFREATQQNAARAGERITQRNLDVQPTLTVPPGWPVRAILSKDLVLQPWKG